MSATVPGNLRHLQAQINRANTAQLGPTRLGPGDHIKGDDGANEFTLSAAGITLRVHGSVQLLRVALEDERTARISGQGALQANINSLASTLGAQITALQGQTAGIASKASISSVQAAVNTLSSAINGLASRVRSLELDESVTSGTSTPIGSPPVITT